jgi:hypothetical protein
MWPSNEAMQDVFDPVVRRNIKVGHMGLFNARQSETPRPADSSRNLPISPVDLSKWYDVYCTEVGHDRVYENVQFIGIRTFDRITEYYSSGLATGFLEIESADGSRWLIPTFGIRLICEHGMRPAFKTLRHRRAPRD